MQIEAKYVLISIGSSIELILLNYFHAEYVRLCIAQNIE